MLNVGEGPHSYRETSMCVYFCVWVRGGGVAAPFQQSDLIG